MPYQHNPTRSLVGIMPEITRLAREQAGQVAPAPLIATYSQDEDDGWVCSVCAYARDTFDTEEDAKAHISDIHLHRFDCEICGVFFPTEIACALHREQYHDNGRRYGSRRCPKCPFAAYNSASFDTHSHDGHGFWACGKPNCDVIEATKKKRDEHRRTAHPTLRQTLSEVKHSPDWDPTRSLVGILEGITRRDREQEADNARGPQRGRIYFERHQLQNGIMHVSDWNHGDPEAEREIGCGECGQVFATEEESNAHLDNYMIVHNFSCRICNVNMGSRKGIDAHIALYHECTERLKFKCHLCPQQCGWRRQFDHHMRSIHGIKAACGAWDCNQTFDTRANRHAHWRKHTKEEDK
jgi:hypothetical protein